MGGFPRGGGVLLLLLLLFVKSEDIVFEIVLDGEPSSLLFKREWSCGESYAAALSLLEAKQGSMLLGNGCKTVECSAMLLVHHAFGDSCELYSRALFSDIQLERTVRVVGSVMVVRFPKAADAKEAASRVGGDDAVALAIEAAARFDWIQADLASTIQLEIAYWEAGRTLPPAYVEDEAEHGWQKMPGYWPTLYAGSWVRAVLALLKKQKSISVNFVGGLATDLSSRIMRGWVLDFAREHCAEDCYLAFTDAASKAKDADHLWRNPKQHYSPEAIIGLMNSPARAQWLQWLATENRTDDDAPTIFGDEARRTLQLESPHLEYYDLLSRSRFTLAPAGDGPWSNRFFEALMCCSIPIVQRAEHAGRTDAEVLARPYFFYVYDPLLPTAHYVYDQRQATANLHAFLRLNTLLDLEEFRHLSCPSD